VNSLTAFGLFAVTAMLVMYALENRHHSFILGFAFACLLGSIYGFLQGAWPFGLVEAFGQSSRPERGGSAGKFQSSPPAMRVACSYDIGFDRADIFTLPGKGSFPSPSLSGEARARAGSSLAHLLEIMPSQAIITCVPWSPRFLVLLWVRASLFTRRHIANSDRP